MQLNPERRAYIVDCQGCLRPVNSTTSAAYYTALEHPAPPDAFVQHLQHGAAAMGATASAVQPRHLPADEAPPQHRHHHHQHYHKHHHRQHGMASATVPPANALPDWLVTPDGLGLQPYAVPAQVALAPPDLAVVPACENGAYWAAGTSGGASLTAAGTDSESLQKNKHSSTLTTYLWYHGVVTCLEMCLAFTLLVLVGVMLLFLYVTSGLGPFRRETTTTDTIGTMFYDRHFDKGHKAITSGSHRALPVAGSVPYGKDLYVTRGLRSGRHVPKTFGGNSTTDPSTVEI